MLSYTPLNISPAAASAAVSAAGTDSGAASEAAARDLTGADAIAHADTSSVGAQGDGTDSGALSESGSVTQTGGGAETPKSDSDSATLTEVVALAISYIDSDSVVVTDSGYITIIGEDDIAIVTVGDDIGLIAVGASGGGAGSGGGGTLVVVGDRGTSLAGVADG